MTRPESPVARFARELRELREKAGSPSFRSMQDVGFVSYSSLCRATRGHRLPTWSVVHGFVIACGGDPLEWKARWEAARAETGSLPDPADVETVPQLRCAVHEILSRHDVGVVSTTMRAPLSTVRQLGRLPDIADRALFERFLRACGATDDEVREWTQAWLRILGPADERAAEPVGARPAEPAAARTGERAGARTVEPADHDQPVADGLDEVADYDALLARLRDLGAAGRVSAGDVERDSGGRLTAELAGAILAGVRPASGEEFVLLLRALGLRAGVDRWVAAWVRVNGSALGRRQPACGVRVRLRRVVHALMLALVGLSVVAIGVSPGCDRSVPAQVVAAQTG